jgi:methylmalonyl-CoA mutase C-terminal domain/subunit
VLGGGIIPEGDVPALKAKGTQEIFGPGSSTQDIIAYIREHVHQDA